MDEWDSVRQKIKELEQSFLGKSPEVRSTLDTVSVADFWKRRYEDEKQIWERMLSSKEKEQAQIQEKFQKDEQGIRELSFRIRELENKLDAERKIWEERSKVRLFEAELEKGKVEWEDKLLMVQKENEQLKQRLAKGAESSEEESKLRKQMEAEKKRMEEGLRDLEKKIESISRDEERKIDALESQKRDLLRELDDMEKIKRTSLTRNSGLEKEMALLEAQRNRELRFLEQRETEHFETFEELTRGFAHRVRNYLGIMSGTLELCTQNLKMDEELKKQLVLVDENAHDMMKSIEEFLNLIKMPEMNLEPLSLNDILSSVLFGLEETFKGQNVKVEKNLAETLPKTSVDLKLMYEAFRHLFLNAVEASPPGAAIAVTTSSDEPRTSVKIQIVDQGKGIPEDQLKKVFRPYFTTSKGKKGLGLTIAKHAIDLHHGTLSISSAPGRGTTVTVQVPVTK